MTARRPLRLGSIAAALIAAIAVTSCSKATGPGNDAASSTRPGLLRIVNVAEPDTLNPVVGNEAIEADLAELWGGMLFEWSDRNAFVPDLATVVPTLKNGGISPDGKTIVYHLRPGVRWQDGAPFGADDVIFSWHAVMNKRNNVPSTVGFDLIAAIDKRDAQTIAVRLRKPWAPFVATFFAPSSQPYPVLPAHLLARYSDINQVAFNSKPVGTGPFVVDRWQRGSRIVFHANPHYWRGAPKLKEIWYTPIADDNTILTLLQAHQADLQYRAPATYVEQFRALPGFSTRLNPYTEYGFYSFNLRTPALQDVRVRRALWSALDIPAILHDVTHDVDVPGYTDQPRFLWAYDPRATHYPYDPVRARALLDAAGWKLGSDGIRIKNGARLALALASSTGAALDAATNLEAQRYWHDVGVDVQIKTYTTSLFFAAYGAGGTLMSGKYDIASYAWTNGTDPDDSAQWMCDQFPPAGQNQGRYCDPKLDAAERTALATSDVAARKRAYDTIQETWTSDVPGIILYYARRVVVANVELRNYRPAHAVSDFWNAYDWDI
jgi:peptide/nickel transport system substrate-binding protein